MMQWLLTWSSHPEELDEMDEDDDGVRGPPLVHVNLGNGGKS